MAGLYVTGEYLGMNIEEYAPGKVSHSIGVKTGESIGDFGQVTPQVITVQITPKAIETVKGYKEGDKVQIAVYVVPMNGKRGPWSKYVIRN
jgi:hypothetical protein